MMLATHTLAVTYPCSQVATEHDENACRQGVVVSELVPSVRLTCRGTTTTLSWAVSVKQTWSDQMWRCRYVRVGGCAVGHALQRECHSRVCSHQYLDPCPCPRDSCHCRARMPGMAQPGIACVSVLPCAHGKVRRISITSATEDDGERCSAEGKDSAATGALSQALWRPMTVASSRPHHQLASKTLRQDCRRLGV